MLKKAFVAGFLLAIIMVPMGCSPDGYNRSGFSMVKYDILKEYDPVEVRVIGLTQIVDSEFNPQRATLKAYIDLMDSFGCRVKAPGKLRIELYEYLPRSANNKGRRLMAWPDVELTDAPLNNSHWKDYLRAYQVDMTMVSRPLRGSSYILHTTFITLRGKHLTSDFRLKY